jgi:hypothetical protein
VSDRIAISLYITQIHRQNADEKGAARQKVKKHTTLGIRWWSPTQLLV